MARLHITADNWQAYYPKRKTIVELYNKAQKVHFEQPGLNPESLSDKHLLHLFTRNDIKGGVLAEQLIGNETNAVITFAAIEPERRNQGITSDLVSFAALELAKQGVYLIGVQLNDSDGPTFWRRQGFVHPVPFGNGLALLRE